MLSHTHDSLVRLLTGSPRLLPQLLRTLLGVAVPPDFELLPAPETARPAPPTEYTADGTLVLRNRQTQQRQAFIIEVQLRPHGAKKYTWPLYISSMRQRLRCPVGLVVVTPSASTARWAERPIDLDGVGASVVRPLVLGPAQIPAAPAPQSLAESPALGVLAVIMHGRSPGAATLGKQALKAASGLAQTDLIRAKLYGDLILGFLSDEIVAILREDMELSADEYISEFARSYVRQGREEGRLEGAARLLRLALEARGFVLSDEHGEQIDACTEQSQLERWLQRAMTAADVGSVFEP